MDIELLVSCPNLDAHGSRYSVAIVNRDGVSWLNLDEVICIDTDLGVTGLAFSERFLYLAIQSGQDPRIVELDRACRLIRTFRHNVWKDLHSISYHGGTLLIASTGTDEIYRIKLDSVNPDLEVAWAASNESGMHINSVTKKGDSIYVTLFGERREGQPRCGELRNLTTGETLASDLRDPHSLIQESGSEVGDFFFTESASAVLRRRGAQMDESIQLSGYPRGLIVLPDSYWVGISAWRNVSRSMGTTRQPNDGGGDRHGNTWQRSEIRQISRGGKLMRRLEFTPYAPEIYEIVAMPPGFRPVSTFGDAANRRLDSLYEALRSTTLRI